MNEYYLTKEEREKYNKMLKEHSEKTCINVFDLIEKHKSK